MLLSKVEPIKQGNVVEKYKLGSTTIKICDDVYRDKTKEELEILDKIIAETAWKCVLHARANEKAIQE